MFYGIFVGGSAPSFSECVGEGEQRVSSTLPTSSLVLTSDPPGNTRIPME